MQNLKCFWCGFLCRPLILFLSEWKRKGFSFLDMFFFLQVLWYDNFLLPSFGNHLGLCVTTAAKKNPVLFYEKQRDPVAMRSVQEFIKLKFCCEGRKVILWVDVAAESISLNTESQLWMLTRRWRLGAEAINWFRLCQKIQITHYSSLTFKCSWGLL